MQQTLIMVKKIKRIIKQYKLEELNENITTRK